jgi:uncharacterized membrane protein YkoI
MRRLSWTSFVIVVLLSLGIQTSGQAEPKPISRDLFDFINSTKISLDDAIKIAEQTVSGKLIRATIEPKGNVSYYKIVLADKSSRSLTYIRIDPNTGKVQSLRTYRADWKPRSITKSH